MAKTNVLLKAFDDRWRKLRKEWHRTRRKYSEDSVHNLRVASRRVIAVLDTLRNLLEDSALTDGRRRIKKCLDALGPLRDVQVQRSHIATMTARHPQLVGFEKSLLKKEERTARKVKKLLEESSGLGRSMVKARRHARKQIQPEKILKFIDKRFNKVIELEAKLGSSDIQTIHEMRLAFKKFRYTCEVVQPMIGKRVDAEQLKRFRAYQTMMGDIQDMEILSAALSKWAGRKGVEQDLERAFEELKNEREKRFQTFMASASQVHSFWKPDVKR